MIEKLQCNNAYTVLNLLPHKCRIGYNYYMPMLQCCLICLCSWQTDTLNHTEKSCKKDGVCMIKNRHFSTPLGVYHLAFVDKNDIRCFYKV